jgi:CDP-diacylglycerol--serine O-phosphatidyltransferase
MVFGLKSFDINANEILDNGFVDWAMARVLPIITLMVALLMVSRVRYADTFRYVVRGRRNVGYLIKLIFAVAVVFVLPQIAVPLLFGWYTFSTPLRAFWNRQKKTVLPETPAVTTPLVAGPDDIPASKVV